MSGTTCVQFIRGGIALPGVAQDERPEVFYKPLSVVEVGCKAFIVPTNRFSALWLTTDSPVWTSKVIAYNAYTGAFETRNIRYVLDCNYTH